MGDNELIAYKIVTEKQKRKRKGERKPHRVSVKKEVLVKQKYRCFNCGYMLTASPYIHHKDGDIINNKLSNLFALCLNCHIDYHQI